MIVIASASLVIKNTKHYMILIMANVFLFSNWPLINNFFAHE